ncbi:hypothetical protein WR25_01928 [Diploscapter pachys]|uniref:Uncharacterized protein n=1 Tax=Diploscapter pachys TaxID=2018661 RepID=A0A2A2JQR9_9BILA|nr:hypothetical protein WR25_01928 [Diploscapter pachys]
MDIISIFLEIIVELGKHYSELPMNTSERITLPSYEPYLRKLLFMCPDSGKDEFELEKKEAEEAWKEREKQVQLMMMENREEIERLWGELEESRREFRESQRKLEEIEKAEEAWKEREKQVQLMMMENRKEIEWLWGELEESQRRFRVLEEVGGD